MLRHIFMIKKNLWNLRGSDGSSCSTWFDKVLADMWKPAAVYIPSTHKTILELPQGCINSFFKRVFYLLSNKLSYRYWWQACINVWNSMWDFFLDPWVNYLSSLVPLILEWKEEILLADTSGGAYQICDSDGSYYSCSLDRTGKSPLHPAVCSASYRCSFDHSYLIMDDP